MVSGLCAKIRAKFLERRRFCVDTLQSVYPLIVHCPTTLETSVPKEQTPPALHPCNYWQYSSQSSSLFLPSPYINSNIVTSFLYFPSYNFPCSRKYAKNPSHPSNTSRYVSSKSPVYHGSAISPGRSVKSNKRDTFCSGSFPKIRIILR